jgi:tripartite-type tricarboxylate transporter receptor subunit TctC
MKRLAKKVCSMLVVERRKKATAGIGRCGALAIAVAAVTLLALPRATAQDYPTRPITLVVGFAAGGFADGFARVLGGKLSERLGQNVVIENRAGGGGNIAAAAVAKAAPDGHTLLVTTSGIAINETLSRSKGFAVDDLTAIAMPVWAPETLSVHPTHPAQSLAELIRIARSKPISYGSPGVGTSGHIANAFFFKQLARIDATHVPFQGGAPAVNAMIGGHIDALVGAVPGYVGQLQSRIIRGLAVASEQRLSQFPDIPTYVESGYPGFLAATWVGVFVPARTSDAIGRKLNAVTGDIIREPDAQARLAALHMQIRHGNQPEAAAYFKSEVGKWAQMVNAIGLQGN